MFRRIAPLAIIVGAIAYCKYQEHKLNREIARMQEKIKRDQASTKENLERMAAEHRARVQRNREYAEEIFKPFEE